MWPKCVCSLSGCVRGGGRGQVMGEWTEEGWVGEGMRVEAWREHVGRGIRGQGWGG